DVAAQKPASADALDVVQLQPDFYMIAGAGGNIAVQVGAEGVIVVDAGTAQTADAVVAAVKKITDQPIRYVINTNADADHVGGNEKLSKAGRALGGVSVASVASGGAAGIISREEVLTRMSAQVGEHTLYPVSAWPTESYTRKQKTLYVNGEGIQVLYQPAAHTDGDSIVFFRRSDVVVAGDVFDVTRFPVIDVARGGSIQGELDALNRLIDLTIPSIPLPFKEGGTRVIPGHGRVCEQAEVVEYRDMVTIVRDSVRRFIAKGMTLEQIKAANPTQGYRGRYGADTGAWTTDMFVEAIYKGLAVKK
ncbi:MAG: MBL fold metallo-hydrolase, partial [Acidobacteriota bacterium]